MKRKLLVGALASSVAVGGSIGASALSDSITSTTSSKTGLEVDSEMEAQAQAEPNTNKLIGVEELQDIVLSEVNGTIEEVELETKGEMNTYFEVEVHQGEKQFIVYVDAYNGTILNVKNDVISKGEQCEKAETKFENKSKTSVSSNQSQTVNQTQAQAESKTEANTKSQTATNVKSEENEEKSDQKGMNEAIISKEQAIKVALEVATGKVSEIELEESEDGLIYDIQLKGSLNSEIKVDAKTGSILGVDLD